MEEKKNLFKISKHAYKSEVRMNLELPEGELEGDLTNPVFEIKVKYVPKSRSLVLNTNHANLLHQIGIKFDEYYIKSKAQLNCGVVSDNDTLKLQVTGKDEDDNFIDVKMEEILPGEIRVLARNKVLFMRMIEILLKAADDDRGKEKERMLKFNEYLDKIEDWLKRLP